MTMAEKRWNQIDDDDDSIDSFFFDGIRRHHGE
jgi:hypothetical protein